MTYYNPQRIFIQRVASRLRSVASRARMLVVDHWLALLVIVLILFVLVVLTIVICGYLYDWRWTGVLKKTFYDWLELLIVPIVLGIGGYVVARAVTQSEQRTASKQAQEAQRDASLNQIAQIYLTEMSQLLLDKDRPLREAVPGDDLSLVARARTLNVLEALDPPRKGSILRFVADTGLLGPGGSDSRGIIDLAGVNISGADLRRYDLRRMDLSYTNLSGANLRESDLAGANLFRATLRDADLSGARLSDVELGEADLLRANLSGSLVSGVDFRYARLSEADLQNADLSMAKLERALLRDADLRGAHLAGANLTGADLIGASLRDADLKDTDLANARATDLQLSESQSLEGATMPNGQKYDDWLK